MISRRLRYQSLFSSIAILAVNYQASAGIQRIFLGPERPGIFESGPPRGAVFHRCKIGGTNSGIEKEICRGSYFPTDPVHGAEVASFGSYIIIGFMTTGVAAGKEPYASVIIRIPG
jgi:hypothetical protein